MIRCATSSCVILVGGFGRSVGTLAGHPRALAEVGGRPFLDVPIREASRRGFPQVLLLAGDPAVGVVEYANSLRRAKTFPVDVDVAVAPEPLGSAGAIANAAERLEDEFLLLDGESWFDFNWLDLRQVGTRRPETRITLALRRHAGPGRYDAVDLRDGRVREFTPKAVEQENLVGAGVYWCRRSAVGDVSPRDSLASDMLPRLAAAGHVAGWSMTVSLSMSAFRKNWDERKRQSRRHSDGRQLFSTGTALLIRMLVISIASRTCAGFRAPRRRSNS